MVFNKIRGVYPTVNMLWSNIHKLMKNPVFITGMPFYFAQAI